MWDLGVGDGLSVFVFACYNTTLVSNVYRVLRYRFPYFSMFSGLFSSVAYVVARVISSCCPFS